MCRVHKKHSNNNTRTYTLTKTRTALVVGLSLIIQLMWSERTNGQRTGWTTNKRERILIAFDYQRSKQYIMRARSLRLLTQRNRKNLKERHLVHHTICFTCVCVRAGSWLNCTCANEGRLCKTTLTRPSSQGLTLSRLF